MGNKNNLKAWLYLLPAIILLGVFMVYPLIDVFVYSFEENYNFVTQRFTGVGFENYLYVLSDDEFMDLLLELENVTYEFDAEKILPILDELSKYTYNSKDLAKELKPVYKKVEMFDFMSAYEAVAKMSKIG